MKLYSLPVASLLLGSVAASAASSNTLDTVVVTATRTAKTVDQSMASVSVITRQDIEQSQALSVQELLRGVPGVSIANNGGLGKNTSVFLRGTESDHVLVLVDGIKVGSATSGSTAFQDIPLDQIERIEIVRGPRSSLYGSEAIGGVIQFFTRKGGGELKPRISVGAGSDETYQVTAGLSGGGDNSWFNASLSGLNTQGFNSCDGKPSPGGAGCFTVEPDEDGYENQAAALRGGYRFDNGAELDLNWSRALGESEFDGGFQNESDTQQELFGGRFTTALLDNWQVTLLAGRSKDKSDNFKDGVFSSRFNTERDTASLQNDIDLSDAQLLTVGLDYQKDRVVSSTSFAQTQRDNKGLFAQYQLMAGAHDVAFSLRGDDNQQFGHHNTGSLGWGYQLTDGLRAMASYGTAFKAPSFNELYFPGYGNANLNPEQSRSVELGLAGEAAIGHWSANLYQTDIDDLIAYDASIFAPGNVDQARIRGLELAYDTALGAWQLASTLTLLDPENRGSGSNRGNVLARRAQKTLYVDLNRDYGRYTTGVTLNAAGKRYDDLANTRRLGGYSTLDLRVAYDLAEAWTLQGRVNNLFDKEYETASFYNQQGRALFVSLTYAP